MIHRPLIFYSFQSNRFAHTRRNCVSAAMTIVQERRALATNGDVFIWTHSAFCTTAALVLAFEVTFHPEDARCDSYAEAVQEALLFLSGRDHDVLAKRGVILITAILSNSPLDQFRGDLDMADESASFEEIMRRFATEFAFLGFANTDYTAAALPLGSECETDGLFVGELGEFGTWFQDTFCNTALE